MSACSSAGGRAPLRVAFVLWDGSSYGGAETATISLAARLAEDGEAPAIVFVGDSGLYRPVLDRTGIAHASLGLPRGSHVLRHPGAFANLVGAHGRDAAVLVSSGFMARALRIGGYRNPVVGVEHGGLLQYQGRGPREKLRDIVDRILGLGALDAQIAVSHFLHDRLLRVPHARRIEVIHNGVDLESYASATPGRMRQPSSEVVIGTAGRLVAGKGHPDLIDALAMIGDDPPWRLVVAGDGPLRRELQEQTMRLGIEQRVEFKGWVDDMAAFWAGCDIAVAASNGLVESFGMTVVEALASGIPAIVSRSGGLTEVLGDSGAGATFAPGDVQGLRNLLISYMGDAALRERSGADARARSGAFSIQQTAAKYRALLLDLIAEHGGPRP